MISIVNRILQTDEELIHKLMNSNFSEEIANAAKEICDVFRKNGKVMIIGNGGSAADAQHFAAELVGRFQYNRRPLPAIALNADSAVLTSIANDYSYNSVFERQIAAISSAEDIVICLSTSGDSMNVVEAMKYTQYRSIQSHLHRLGYCSSILSISSYPFLSVLPSHPAFLPFPLSDTPPYHTPKYQFQQGVHITFRL